MITQTKKYVRIPLQDWNELKKNPSFIELVELLEDQKDLIAAKSIKGKDISIEGYLKKRGLRRTS